MDAFMQALAAVFAPAALFYTFLGVLFGILCGAMPGLSAVMAVSIMLPFTFSLKDTGIMMLLGIFAVPFTAALLRRSSSIRPAQPIRQPPVWTAIPWPTSTASLDGP